MSIRSNVDRGEFDQRIRLERNTITYDASNYPTPNWGLLIACWARVDATKVNGRSEPETAGAIQSVGDYRIWVRSDIMKRFSLTVADRVVWRGQYFDIKDIPDQQWRGRKIALICQAGQNNG